MSGFLPDIARWALGGGAGGAGGTGDGDGSGGSNGNDNNGNNNDGNANVNTLSEEEIRAKRMARLAALENRQSSSASAGTENAVVAPNSENGADSADAEKFDNMEIDGGDEEAGGSGRKIDNISGGPRPMDVDHVPREDQKPAADATIIEPAPKKQAKETTAAAATVSKSKIAPATPLDPVVEAARKLRRKKLLLLRRVLLVTIASPDDDASSFTSDKTAACVKLVVDDPEIACTADSAVGGESGGDVGTGFQTHHIAEILASRLSLSPSAKSLETMPPQHKCGIIGYLGGCYKRAGEEWKEVRNGLNEKKAKSSAGGEEELLEILEEIRKQVRFTWY